MPKPHLSISERPRNIRQTGVCFSRQIDLRLASSVVAAAVPLHAPRLRLWISAYRPILISNRHGPKPIDFRFSGVRPERAQ
jgi:hypothetical protein